jgi:FkbM family methyltransferase
LAEELKFAFRRFVEDKGSPLGALDYMLALRREFSNPLVLNLLKSKSQLGQDLFVLSQTAFKRDGFFVEFGATDGIDLSNTHILEKEFGWDGILAEPGKIWHSRLTANRNCRIDTGCVWRSSGERLCFNQTAEPEFSTVDEFSSADQHAEIRTRGETYKVETISLADLLEKHNAPERIDYLSIDTGGSEYEILRDFDFDKYRFGVITCEHNFTPMREALHALLKVNGYARKYEELSQFDDWFVNIDRL